MTSKAILKDMEAFGLSKEDIDSDGLVTLYHGGVELPEKLNEGEIFFMTPSIEEAKDYARIRGGEVFTLKVKPEYVNFNQGSYEVEFDLGGRIQNGEIIPAKIPKKEHDILDKNITYKNYAIGDILPKTKYEILDIVIHKENLAQFYLETGNGQHWYDAETVIKYEGKKQDKESNLSLEL